MGFGIDDVRGAEADSRDSGDRCRKLFENWLSGPGGHTPKSWKNLLEWIEAVSEFISAAEEIKKELLSSKHNNT